jgi:hypothetical protein
MLAQLTKSRSDDNIVMSQAEVKVNEDDARLRTTEEAVTSFPPNDNGTDGNWCWRRDDEHYSRPVLSMFS